MNNTFYCHPLHQSLAVITPPASEPVTTAEAKLWLRQEESEDDALIDSLISAARAYAEAAQKRQLLQATLRLSLDQFPVLTSSWRVDSNAITLPLPKLVSVSSITYIDQSGNSTVMSPSLYTVDKASQPGRIMPVYWQPWPTVRPQIGAVQVQYVAGYANAAAVPEATKTAIKLLVAHWYRNREAVGNVGGPIELAVSALLAVDAVGAYQ